MVLGVLGKIASILFVVFAKLGFDVKHTLILSLQGMLPYLHLLLPYLISVLLAWTPEHEYLELNLLVGFAHLEHLFVVAWRLLVSVAVAVLDKGLLLCCSTGLPPVGCRIVFVGAVLGKALVVL